MSARKRKTGEKFKQYRESIKAEAHALKQRLRGRMFFNPYVDKGTNRTYRRKK